MPTEKRIAVTHPGKHGDAIYVLPALRALCDRHHCKADFYTSDYCAPLKSLFEAQYAVDHFYVALNYVVERMDMGVQPAYVPVDSTQYEAVYQLGYCGTPDRPLPEFIAQSVPIELKSGVWYDVPAAVPHWDGIGLTDYVVLAPRGESSYRPMFQEVIRQSPWPVVIVGGSGDANVFLTDRTGDWLNLTDVDYLETAYIISKAKAFVGLISSQLCLANGFPIPRVTPHDGIHWDSRHWIRSKYNHYPVNPSAEQVLEIIQNAL